MDYKFLEDNGHIGQNLLDPYVGSYGKALSVILAGWGKKLLDPRHCNLSLKLSFKEEL